MSKEQITKAIKSCASAQKAWAAFSLFHRCEILLEGANHLYEHLEEIAYIMADEISKEYKSCVSEVSRTARRKGGIVTEFGTHKGNLIYPTVIDYTTKAMAVFYDEPFGPVLPIIRVSNIEEAVQVANDAEYGLQASIFGKNIDDLFQIAAVLDAGTINLNGKSERCPDNFPFLGRKNSGIGVQGVQYTLLASSTLKSIVVNL